MKIKQKIIDQILPFNMCEHCGSFDNVTHYWGLENSPRLCLKCVHIEDKKRGWNLWDI